MCMFYFVSRILAELYIGCDIPQDKEFVITLFHKDNCITCDDVMPFIEEIDSRLERNNKKVAVRYKNCSTCQCDEEKDDKFPVIKIHNNTVELSKIDGSSKFDEIAKKIIETTGYERSIFTKRIKTNPGHVVKLTERDFFSGFDGPWIILFYNKTSDAKRELIYQLAPKYKTKLNVGEINGNNSDVLLNRFAISYLPAIVAMDNGLLAGYSGKDSINDLFDFADELIKPSFTNLTLEDFNNLKKITPQTDPIFIVFYNEVAMANEKFKNIAHEYKFKANIYKSNDPKLMELAKVEIDKKKLVVTVFKHGIFHIAPHSVLSTEKVFEWIWHSHYPSVTRISNENFYSVMHGLKPAMILLSRNEELVAEYEFASEFIHKGEPFTDLIFASVDVEDFSLFIPKLLPKISVPSLAIWNPVDRIFYAKKAKLTQKNIKEYVENMIEEYNLGKLPTYPFKTNHYKYLIVIACVLAVVYLLNRKLRQRKYKIIESHT